MSKYQYLPVVLILLIYVAPLVSLSVALCNISHVAQYSLDMNMVSTVSQAQIDSSHHNDSSHHTAYSLQAVEKSQGVHHQSGWCGYCDLFANISATLLVTLFIPMIAFALIERIKVLQSDIGRRFSHLFLTPRAPPVFSV